MKLKRIIFMCVSVSFAILFFPVSSLFAQQSGPNHTFTMTTYYPAPSGAYDTLRLFPKGNTFVPPDPCDIGTAYVDSEGRFQYCRNVSGTGTWGSVDRVWAQSGNNVYPANTISNLMVGIGTTSPQNLFHVKGSDVAAVFENSADVQIILKAGGQGADSNIKFMCSELGNLHLGRYNDARSTSVVQMAISNAGNVGIGTIGPNARLDVKGAGNGTTSFGLGIRNSNDKYSLIVRDDGNVGIGINPTVALEVGGMIKTTGGLVMETRRGSAPASPVTGQMWIQFPIVCGDGHCDNPPEDCTSCEQDCGCCPVNGGWSDWGGCSVACGGTGTQTRTCTNPPPSCGGANCSGLNSQSCDNGACPFCGDHVCNGGETCSSCPGDCGACPTGCCSPGCSSTPGDVSIGTCNPPPSSGSSCNFTICGTGNTISCTTAGTVCSSCGTYMVCRPDPSESPPPPTPPTGCCQPSCSGTPGDVSIGTCNPPNASCNFTICGTGNTISCTTAGTVCSNCGKYMVCIPH